MDQFVKRLGEGRVDYTKHQAQVRSRGQRVFGPGGPMKRATIRGETDERNNDFHRYEQDILRREAERQGK